MTDPQDSAQRHRQAMENSARNLERAASQGVAEQSRTTRAIREQTGVIREGFAETVRSIDDGFERTVAALNQQSYLLQAIDLGVRSVAVEMRGLREDLYSVAQNREALEAKGKLDRAEQLLER